jgi:hypothetical protein
MSKSKFQLRLYHDWIDDDGEVALSPRQRAIYCVSGQAELNSPDNSAVVGEDAGCVSGGALAIKAGHEGAHLWRWELVAPRTASGLITESRYRSAEAGDYEIELDDQVNHLMRLDRVNFPLGGEALPHIHAAPGVRCLLTGSLRVETTGVNRRIWPGHSWVEHGPDVVYAVASQSKLTSFIRVTIVPEGYRGRPTISYVRGQDRDRVKAQSYKRYSEEPVQF